VRTFEELQQGLGSVLAKHRQGSATEHVVVVLPSLSFGPSVEVYYGARLPSLEHRFLLLLTMLRRLPGCEVVVVTSVAPDPAVWDYYLDLAGAGDRADVARRAHLVTAEDWSLRPLATTLLDRGDLLQRIRDLIAGRPGFIEPYQVTAAEVEVAVRLQLPVNGPAPALARLGYKSGGREVFAEAGVTRPVGREDLRTIDEVVRAALAIQAARPEAQAVVVKLDNSASGVGNLVLDLPACDDPEDEESLRGQLGGLPGWFVSELAGGAIVEERIIGEGFASPSVQADIEPGGRVIIRGTHEQDLSGPHGHTYEGCRFPADPRYSALLAEHAFEVGRVLARRGVVGRFSLDCAVTWQPRRGWTVYALEINLRQGGTSPPLALLANLDPGRYQPDPGRWASDAGGVRCYRSTDNLLDPLWVGLDPARVIAAVHDAGLAWDRARRTGVVLHLLSCLAVDGRMGLTAIAATPGEADALYDQAAAVLEHLEA
jgi:PGM1 C-terminal domain